MKKTIFSFLSVLLFLFTCCQQEQNKKQYFEQSPEIELAKKLMDSYLNQDWEALRSYYSDTARIWNNVWYTSHPGISVDQYISDTKEFVSTLAEYSYEDEVWEMIVNNDGQKWVHFWGNWVGILTQTGNKVEVAAHLAYGVVGDKVVYLSLFVDTLPIYLAQQRLEDESNE